MLQRQKIGVVHTEVTCSKDVYRGHVAGTKSTCAHTLNVAGTCLIKGYVAATCTLVGTDTFRADLHGTIFVAGLRTRRIKGRGCGGRKMGKDRTP